jgi:ribosome-binding factor A
VKQNSSTRRLAEEAREKIATILMMEISDPRLALVTVTGCEVSVDRSVCKVWVSADPDSYDEVLEGLASAKGRIRSLLGRSLTWRVTPELIFQIDRSTDEAMRITEALKNVPPTMSIPKDEFGYPIVEEAQEESDEDEQADEQL